MSIDKSLIGKKYLYMGRYWVIIGLRDSFAGVMVTIKEDRPRGRKMEAEFDENNLVTK